MQVVLHLSPIQFSVSLVLNFCVLVQHQLPEPTQTHVHRVGDVIYSFHPLSSSSLIGFNVSQHQGSRLLEFQLQHQCFQYIFRTDFLQSPCSPRDSQEYSPTPQFKSINSSLLSCLYSPNLTSVHDWCKTVSLTRWNCACKAMSLLLNMLSRQFTAFHPSTKCLLISWQKSQSAIILEPPKIKCLGISIVSPSIC